MKEIIKSILQQYGYCYKDFRLEYHKDYIRPYVFISIMDKSISFEISRVERVINFYNRENHPTKVIYF